MTQDTDALPQTADGHGSYMYCVIATDEPQTFGAPGIGGRGDAVHTVHLDRLAAVVSDSPEATYESTRRNMTAHMRVLEEVMGAFTVVPIRFGSVAPSEDSIRETLLRPRYAAFQAMLGELEGRVEMGLKVFWMQDVLYREVLEEQPEITRLRDKLAGRSPNETYFERVRVGEMLEAAVADKRARESEQIFERLRPLAHKVHVGETLSDQMIVNGAFLVDRAKTDDLDRLVEAMDAEGAERLLFKLVGPVPPYNFVNLDLPSAA